MSQLEDLFRSLAQQLVEVSKQEGSPPRDELVPLYQRSLAAFARAVKALSREQRQRLMDNSYTLRQLCEILPMIVLAGTEDDEVIAANMPNLPIVDTAMEVLKAIDPQSDIRELKPKE